MREGLVLEPVTAAHQTVVERLWELYRHDLSEFRHGMHPGVDGLFRRHRLPAFFAGDDPDIVGYLVVANDLVDAEGTPLGEPRPVGFALLGGLVTAPRHIYEFFVARSVRRRGVGYEVARRVIELHPGPWEIAFQDENAGAARFWRRVVTDVVGADWSQEHRPVPEKPHIPPDTWLSFTVS